MNATDEGYWVKRLFLSQSRRVDGAVSSESTRSSMDGELNDDCAMIKLKWAGQSVLLLGLGGG